ncbi:MAG: beta-N-acetylhexosaminidase [Bdellovibrionales bacterium]
MRFQISSFVAGIVFLCFSLAALAEPPTPTIDKMTLKQRVGQVFIWTYSGTSMSPVMERWLGKYQPGALIVFSRNIKNPTQIAKFNQQTQKFAAKHLKAPFFLMIDQEGGTVTRLRTSVPLPSALALGKMADVKFIESFGKAKGEVLHDIGFNVNLAPVLDISNPDKDSFIGNRAFGDDPSAVAEMATAYALGLNEGGMIPTAKHFPGHGGVIQDSHRTTPKKLATYDELKDTDLVPFEEYAQSEFPRALMMAHLALPNLDPSGLPSTYSKIIIQDYLREKLKYDGLIITDDLEMNGASIEKDIGQRAVKAFLAGNDMVMLAGTPAHQRQAFEAVYAAVRSKKISEARLNESVERILEYKKEMKLGAFIYNEKRTRADIAALETLSREVLKKNFRLSMAGKTASWPRVKKNTEALVLSADKKFYDSFQAGFRGKAHYFQLTPATLERAKRELNNDRYQIAVFYASGAQTTRWLAGLNSDVRSKVIVVNVNNSGELDAQKSFLSVLNINSFNPESGFSLAEALCSPEFRIPASGEEEPEPPAEE